MALAPTISSTEEGVQVALYLLVKVVVLVVRDHFN